MESSSVESGRRYRILCADDDPAILATLAALLQRSGFLVETAPNGADAWERLAADPAGFDLLITDYEMPGLSGLGLIAKLRSAALRTRVVMFSGRINETDAQWLRDVGCQAVVEKGAGAERLIGVVRAVLAAGEDGTTGK